MDVSLISLLQVCKEDKKVRAGMTGMSCQAVGGKTTFLNLFLP